MNLTSEQLQRFDDDGYLFLPALFSLQEVEILRQPIPEVLARRGPETVREEEDEEVAKIVFALHTLSDVYRRLARHPRIVTPVEELLRSKIHVMQTRINPKLGFSGTGWSWHQDFNQWNLADGLQKPRAILTSIFLDEVDSCNAPLMVIRGSQKFGHVPIPDQMVGLPKDVVEKMVDAGKMEAVVGPPGSVIFLDVLTVHGSTANMSPKSRYMYYMAFNAVDNTPIPRARDEYRCSQDYTPVVAMADDCLLTAAAPAPG